MYRLGLGLSLVSLLALGCGDDDTDGADAGPADAAAAQPTVFEVTLSADDEVPLCTFAGEDAAGEGTVTISADLTEVAIELSWEGLSGDATAAHIHSGADGATGGVIFLIGMPPANPATATFTVDDYPAKVPDGAPADFAAFVTAMLAGNSYFNVHTGNCMMGEIRGQIDS
jgi:hypothetical protein